MSKSALKMSFDPNTIEHLGVRMYSTLPPVLTELIANAHDADAENVLLTLKDAGAEKEIIIEDDGAGMSFEEINEKFLRIGRNRRGADGKINTTPKGRQIIGKKGLGKLSFFGIAHEIEISTKKNGKETVFKMVWDDIMKEEKDYAPTIIKRNEPCKGSGTKIILRKMKRKSAFDPEDIADRLSMIFIVEPGFKIEVRHNSASPIVLSNERKYANLTKEIEWRVPKDIEKTIPYLTKKGIEGHLIATEKPIKPSTGLRGITLFSRKKMVNAPEYFSDVTSSHFFSYLTGWLEVDFVDDIKEDVISTNRQSLNWEHEEMKQLRSYLQELVKHLERKWREQRNAIRQKKVSESTGINIKRWLGKLPSDIRKQVEPIITAIVRDAELLEETRNSAVKKLHKLAPEYAWFHWRYLHAEIQSAAKKEYEAGNYHGAALEAVKKYARAVRKKSGRFRSQITDRNLMETSFGKESGAILKVAKKFKGGFPPETLDGIEEGQKLLSEGVICGCRNPLSHEVFTETESSKLFTEKDCLDILSLLSHLFSRLDGAKKTKSPKKSSQKRNGKNK